MITQGRVVAVSGEYATVEVDRKSACEGCHKNTGADGCVVCAIGGNQKITLRARNIADAATGDIVTLSTKTRRVLGYALLVFIMPLLIAAVGYWLGTAFFSGEHTGLALGALGVVLSFGGLWLYSKRVEARCDAEIIAVVRRGEPGGSKN